MFFFSPSYKHRDSSRLILRIPSLLLLCAGLIASGRCGGGPVLEEGNDVQAAQAYAAPRNCLFIILDATAAKHMSLYGYQRRTTPFLDDLARNGTYFSAMFSQDTATLASAWSYVVGRYPYRPRGRMRRFVHVRQEDHPMAEAFQAAGFATGGFSENLFVSEKTGFDKGFDTFTFQPQGKERANLDNYGRDEKSSKRLARGVKEWIESVEDRRWFCYVHFLRPHNPYAAHEPFTDRFVDVEIPKGREKIDFLTSKEIGILKGATRGATIPTRDDVAFLKGLYDGNLAFADTIVQELYAFLEEQDLKPGQSIEVEVRDPAADSVQLRVGDKRRITIGAKAASKLLVELV